MSDNESWETPTKVNSPTISSLITKLSSALVLGGSRAVIKHHGEPGFSPGDWDFLNPKNKGKSEGWFLSLVKDSKTITFHDWSFFLDGEKIIDVVSVNKRPEYVKIGSFDVASVRYLYCTYKANMRSKDGQKLEILTKLLAEQSKFSLEPSNVPLKRNGPSRRLFL